MNKQQRNRLIWQAVTLAVLIIAILFILTGGNDNSGASSSDEASVKSELGLPEIEEVPATLGPEGELVKEEINERDIKPITIDEFDGPNENFFNPTSR